ncbi:MAG: phosphoribosylglycinamide formyltransferase [Flavobacteriales bacterium]|nr:phosphoribosylglycinamide formyltransferase [Flavobacteriales bacterium]
MEKQRIAVLASGSGSNAEAILRYFEDSALADVVWVGCNRPETHAGIYKRTRSLGLETTPFQASELRNGAVLDMLCSSQVDWVVLAGFLLRIPEAMVGHFKGRMVNIHPALLPDFGGKGMYGMHVHQAVKAAGCVESGMTVHWVTSAYDEGDVVFQASCALEPEDEPEQIAQKVAQLEHRYYARAIDALIQDAAEQTSLQHG